MKKLKKVSVTFLAVIILAACQNYFASNEKDQGTVTINIGSNARNISRGTASYPPEDPTVPGSPTLAELKFVVDFTPAGSGTAKTITASGSGTIKSSINVGTYKVTMNVFLLADNSLYARGVAVNNPVTIVSGSNTIDIDAYDAAKAAPPVITAQPQDAVYIVGGTAAALTVSVDPPSDGGTLSYQWYSNTSNSNSGGTSLGTAANTASYTPPTTAAASTYYYVKVSNSSAGGLSTTITSRAAKVAVIADAETPAISAQPAAPSTVPIFSTTFSLAVTASVSDGGSLSYQWYDNTTNSNSGGTAITGAASASYAPPTETLGTVYYYVEVTNTNNAALGNTTATVTSNAVTVTVNEGSGTSSDPFIVYSVETLQRVGKGSDAAWTGNWSLSSYYKQAKNIDLSSVPNWTPIGPSSSVTFTGSYDGDGHTISNLTINTSSDYQGLFGCNGTNAVVKNLGLIDCDIRGGQYVGGVVGYNGGSGSTTVQYCYVTGSVSGTGENVGGVAGYNGRTIQNCYVTASVSSSNRFVGGVVGFVSSGTVQNCYSTGDVSGTSIVGGVVGQLSGNTLENCYATGSVSASAGSNSQVGGVIGFINSGTVKNCVALSPNIFTSNTNTLFGRVSGYGTGTTANKFGRSDMKKNDAAPPAWTWTNVGISALDGADITSADWELESWWTGTAGFSAAVWDFSGISATRGPTLRDMPGGAQNPVIQ